VSPANTQAADQAAFARTLLTLLELEKLPELMQRALQLAVARTGANEAYLELLNDEGLSEVSHVAAEGCSPERIGEIGRVVSRGIISEAMASGRTVETANAQLDARFFELESVKRLNVERVLCVPIGRETVVGVIYLQTAAVGSFTDEARQDIELLSRTFAIAVQSLQPGTGVRRRLAGPADPNDAFGSLVYRSPLLREVVEKLRMAAPLDVHLLLTGPSGSGKTELARAVHLASRRRSGPFMELNCAAIPEGLLESELYGSAPGAHSAVPRAGVKGKVELAEGGTLFLDEIAELSLTSQAKILHLLQSKTYFTLGGGQARQADVRIIAATNVQLRRAVTEKRFREDLFFRLRVLEVRVPSLAERPEDVLPLSAFFLKQALRRHELEHKTFSLLALRSLETAEWTGNVRELAHQVEAGALQAELRNSDRIEPEDLFPEQRHHEAESEPSPSLHLATRAFQRKHVRSVLDATDWNMSETARLLDISRTHLYTLVRTLDINR
jgi:transcriptional regulator with PAS, ATPase and Fis domain